MKKIGIMQPYLFPYIGYFQLIKAVDQFLIYDDVNYIKGGWINRNNILMNGKKILWTLPLNSPSPHRLINEISIFDAKSSKKKLLEQHKNAYRKAPHFKEIIKLLESVIQNDEENLAKYIESSLKTICQYLQINTEIIVSSNLDKDMNLPAEERLIAMVKSLSGNQYINAIGGKELYSKDVWKRNNLELNFIKSHEIRYDQGQEIFIPFLSIIDSMMYLEKSKLIKALDSYELV